jgi:hypothetical protein
VEESVSLRKSKDIGSRKEEKCRDISPEDKAFCLIGM